MEIQMGIPHQAISTLREKEEENGESSSQAIEEKDKGQQEATLTGGKDNETEEVEKGANGASSNQAIGEKDKGQQEPTVMGGKDNETEEVEKGANGASSNQAIGEKDKGKQEATVTEGKNKETEEVEKGANGASSSQAIEEKDLTRGKDKETEGVEKGANGASSSQATEEDRFARMQQSVEDRQRQRRYTKSSIFRVPQSIAGISNKAYQPELVSIGPYYRNRDNLIPFEEHKWRLTFSLFSRSPRLKVADYVKLMKDVEEKARECYSEVITDMSSLDFVEMMLLDGCFIVELLLLCSQSDSKDPIFQMPWLMPILMRDLLKLENQLPFFVLEQLYNISTDHGPNYATNQQHDSLPSLFFGFLDLSIFGLGIIRAPQRFENIVHIDHLLDLFHKSFTPSNPQQGEEYLPSEQAIQCVTLLRSSGIDFKVHRLTESFFDITFKRRSVLQMMKFERSVLKIPPMAINDSTKTLFVNCVALEQCRPYRSMFFTTYVAFMSCLINSPRDVAFLCAHGIISNLSENDQYVADLFNKLGGTNIGHNMRDCYLSEQFREVEAYYCSNWGIMIRTYFRNRWTFISVLSASVLLILTAIQSIMAVMSYIRKK
ncbi:hypothetical protein HHK36_019315 [Tetracentron sinense]|uniref:Uncharacterized protein n=1 Tax=Tetracentron sinense TaxID=13715 RepID=A0A834YTP8_TETSI|nr:hypothetical protein HHK36_019315 [Tetracentron sinense]